MVECLQQNGHRVMGSNPLDPEFFQAFFKQFPVIYQKVAQKLLQKSKKVARTLLKKIQNAASNQENFSKYMLISL